MKKNIVLKGINNCFSAVNNLVELFFGLIGFSILLTLLIVCPPVFVIVIILIIGYVIKSNKSKGGSKNV